MANNTERDAKIGAAIENACEKLPEGYSIEILLEKDSGNVTLVDEDGEDVDFPSSCESFADIINDAVAEAIILSNSPDVSGFFSKDVHED